MVYAHFQNQFYTLYSKQAKEVNNWYMYSNRIEKNILKIYMYMFILLIELLVHVPLYYLSILWKKYVQIPLCNLPRFILFQ